MRHFIFCIWLALAASVSAAEIKFDFSPFADGSSPTNFHSALAGGGQPGEWKVLLDDVPPLLAPLSDKAPSVSKRAVFAQTSRDATAEHFPMFIYDGETFKDFKLTTRFKIIGGAAEQMAGVVFRFQNESNFYVVRASALGKNISFYKRVNGQIASPVRLALEISTNVWHELVVDCSGTYIECQLDGQKVLPTITDDFPAEGKVGFWTKSDAVSYFCDTTIDYTPRIPAAQSLVDDILEQQPRILGLQIYALNKAGQTRVIGSKDKSENGQPGADAEKKAISDGAIFYQREKGVDILVLPFRDRNGDPMAAVRLRLKSFLGETEKNAVLRATMILKLMEGQVTSSDALLQ
jgi:hypothetical protein